jgi:hypothetical protein
LDGKIDDKKPNVMDTSEFFQVTKNKVGYRLREVLSGKSKYIREKDPEGNNVVYKAYVFTPEKLGRIAKKYGYEFVIKFSSESSSEGRQALESMEKDQIDNVEKDASAPLQLDKLNNLITNDKHVENNDKLEEALGHKPKPVRETEEEAARRLGLRQCQECKAKGKRSFFATDADLAIHMRAYHEVEQPHV